MSTSMSDPERAQLLRLVGALRGLVDASVALHPPLPELTALADAAEALRTRAAPHAGERPFPRYGAPDGGDLDAILPWSPISGRYNPIAAPVSMSMLDGKAIGTARLGLAYEGPPGGVHGGIVAAIWDQVLAYACMVHGKPGPTATFTTHFRAITPLHDELRFTAWVDRSEGRRVYARGHCHAGDKLVSEADGIFIHR